jgi:hypothetical protein
MAELEAEQEVMPVEQTEEQLGVQTAERREDEERQATRHHHRIHHHVITEVPEEGECHKDKEGLKN